MSAPPRPELAVGAVVVRDGRLLLIRRATDPARGRWSLPGGRVEPGETTAEAVTRELREETGLLGECGALVGWVERVSDQHHFVIIDFEVRVLDRGEPRPGDDADAVRWVPVDEVVALDTVPGLVEFLGEHGVIDATA